MGAKNNRNKGHKYERDIVNDLKELGFEAVTSRAESRNADNRGIDIVTNFPLNIQAKVSINQPNFHSLLNTTDADVVFFKKQEKAAKNFLTKGEYVCLRKEDFLKLFKNE